MPRIAPFVGETRRGFRFGGKRGVCQKGSQQLIRPQPNVIYRIELCSGEIRRWRSLPPRSGEAMGWWRDLESGREFSEASLMYAWRILSSEDDDWPEESRSS